MFKNNSSFAISFLVSLSFLVFSAGAASLGPGPDRVGAGFMVGNFISATGKYWLDSNAAIDAGLGFASSATVVYGDYLWHFHGLFGNGTKFGRETSGYIGGGGGVAFWGKSSNCEWWSCGDKKHDSGTALILRGLFGFEWFPRKPPLGVFAEIGPAVEVITNTGGFVNLGLGARYYF